jgi:hypothetical protein
MALAISSEIDSMESIRSRNILPSFAQLLAQFRGRRATKAEDKVFGLAGVVEDFDELIVVYGLSVAEVYERCTRTIIETSQSLDILTQVVSPSNVQVDSSPDHQLPVPSWVPNWTELMDHDRLGYHLNRSICLGLYSASGKKTCDFIESHNGLLQIEGVTWDSITSVGEPIDNADYPANAPIFRSWHWLAETTLPSQDYISSGTLKDAFWRTLCMDYLTASNRTPTRAKANHRAVYDLWWQLELMIDAWDSEVDVETMLDNYLPTLPNEVHQFDSSVMTCAWNRRFFISEKGYIGFAPSHAAPGDTIVVLFGGNVPYILRKNEPATWGSSETTYIFLGDSYVHGIMDGEVIESLERGDVAKELITLK